MPFFGMRISFYHALFRLSAVVRGVGEDGMEHLRAGELFAVSGAARAFRPTCARTQRIG